MAQNLRAGIPPNSPLLLYDTNTAALSSFTDSTSNVSTGRSSIAKIATLQEIGQQADVILTMLPNSEHVEECYNALFPTTTDTGQNKRQQRDGLDTTDAGQVNEKRLLIDCSTIDPFRSTSLGESLRSRGLGSFIDAPVSGGVAGAKNSKLSFMVGCHPPSAPSDPSADNLATRVHDVLQHMGATFHFCGKAGNGLAAKLVNNYLLALNNLATAEAMNLGLRLGLQSGTLGQVINSSTGYCWPSQKNNPVMGITPGAPVENGYAGGFGIELMIKDLMLAGQAAKGSKTYLESFDAALDTYKTVAADSRWKGKDFGIVLKHFEELSANSKT